MKNPLLAISLAAGLAAGLLSTFPAHAGDVTLYGIVDAGIGYNAVKRGDKTQSHVRSISGVESGPRIGMRGVETLGDGARAVFKLEGGFSANDGRSAQGGRLFGRAAWVGLESDHAGGLYFGRQNNSAFEYLDGFDPFGAGYGMAGNDTVFSFVRADNMIVYKTAKAGGWSARAGYSFNVSNTDRAPQFQTHGNDRLGTLAVVYENGPFRALGLYDEYRLGTNSASRADKIRAGVLAGSYAFEAVQAYVAVGRTHGGWISGKDIDGTLMQARERLRGTLRQAGFSATSSMLGISMPFGAGRLLSSWQRAKPNNASLTGGRHAMNIYAIGYRYELSARTSLYSYAALSDNYAFNKVQDRALGVGMRHAF
jgi:predicted porin